MAETNTPTSPSGHAEAAAGPAYAEYGQIRAEAVRAAPRIIGPVHINRWSDIATRRGYDWCTAVLGKAWQGVHRSTPVDCEILAIADHLDLTPQLPEHIVAERRAARSHRDREELRRAEQQITDEARWAAARRQCKVPVQVQPNTQGRRTGTGMNDGPLRHVVPLADAMSSPTRPHPAGRALCESPTRAKPLKLGDATTEPATCLRCLNFMPKIRRAGGGDMPQPGPLPPANAAVVWGVRVESEPAEGRQWMPWQLEELADKHGYGTDAYLDAVGPDHGAVITAFYGPYTEKQAHEVAEYLTRPDVAEREHVGTATPVRLHRYLPKPTPPPGPAEAADDRT